MASLISPETFRNVFHPTTTSAASSILLMLLRWAGGGAYTTDVASPSHCGEYMPEVFNNIL
jgi:hypothetical protein